MHFSGTCLTQKENPYSNSVLSEDISILEQVIKCITKCPNACQIAFIIENLKVNYKHECIVLDLVTELNDVCLTVGVGVNNL